MIKRIFTGFFILFSLLLVSGGKLYAQEVSGEEVQKIKDSPEIPVTLTRDEMMERIKGVFQHRLDVVATMPDLEREESASGVVYKYKGVDVDGMDEKELFGLLKIVNSQLSWHNLQKLQRQLKDIKKIKEINKTQKDLK